eukprot:TRINITY_DN22179_c0_g1_i1.p1 TRINITY_DN22179_c0_g1~~TRINITY_DN22179_c0_g1_i1.p1  ORF type:complete len:156 (-),score=5.66 TRINITY_DN22179_c0_g1_i1:161-628(-)
MSRIDFPTPSSCIMLMLAPGNSRQGRGWLKWRRALLVGLHMNKSHGFAHIYLSIRCSDARCVMHVVFIVSDSLPLQRRNDAIEDSRLYQRDEIKSRFGSCVLALGCVCQCFDGELVVHYAHCAVSPADLLVWGLATEGLADGERSRQLTAHNSSV